MLQLPNARCPSMQHLRQHFQRRAQHSFGFWNGLQYFLERRGAVALVSASSATAAVITTGLIWTCAGLRADLLTVSQHHQSVASPSGLKQIKWFYRVIGPFAAPGLCLQWGIQAVAPTLRCLAPKRDTGGDLVYRAYSPASQDQEVDFLRGTATAGSSMKKGMSR